MPPPCCTQRGPPVKNRPRTPPCRLSAFAEKELAKRRGVEYVPKVSTKIEDPDFMKAEAEAVQVGMRCSCEPGDRRGEVMFVGKVEELPLGYWVGVKYDEPLGKNDGSVKVSARVILARLPLRSRSPSAAVAAAGPLNPASPLSTQGKRVFECPPNFGGFLRPDKVKVGDFPPVEEEDSDFGSEPDEI